jgi:hypothetical protein
VVRLVESEDRTRNIHIYPKFSICANPVSPKRHSDIGDLETRLSSWQYHISVPVSKLETDCPEVIGDFPQFLQVNYVVLP